MQNTVILNQNKIFLALYKRGKAIVSPNIIIYVRKNRLGLNRFGITAGKKVGNAVCRNRAKRIIRQAYRETEELMPKGIDIVIVARSSIINAKSSDISQYIKTIGIRRIMRAIGNGSDNKS